MRRILIVDDHALVRMGLKQVLSSQGDAFVVGEAGDADQALNKLDEEQWDALVLDISLPDKHGLELLKVVKAKKSKLPVLILSVHAESVYAAEALRLGASGYLCKDKASEDLVEALAQVIAGQTYIHPDYAKSLMGVDPTSDPLETLSERERQVFRMLVDGKGVTDIAKELELSVKTISTYRSRIFQKLQVNNTMEFFRYVTRKGLMKA